MELLQPYESYIVVALAVLALLQFLLIFSLNGRMSRMSKTLRSVMMGPGGEDLEAMLARCLNESKQALNQSSELETRLQTLTEEMRNCVQHIGLVRYDAYGDVSGAQSFSLALLDNHQNGAILTGLLGRNDGRCYGKPVVNGQTEQTLSEEELTALKMALDGSPKTLLAPAAPGRRRDKGMASRAG
jgi:hypothetical protein